MFELVLNTVYTSVEVLKSGGENLMPLYYILYIVKGNKQCANKVFEKVVETGVKHHNRQC